MPTQVRGVQSWFEKGRMYAVTDDVLGVVQQIREISPRIHVFFNEQSGEFDLVEENLEGTKQSLIFSVKELDARVVPRLRRADQWRGREDPTHVLPEGEDFVSEMDRANERIDAAVEAATKDRLYDSGERLAWALGEDGKGTHASILIPRGVSGPNDES